MPSLKLRKPFRYRQQPHASGDVIDVDARDVKVLTVLGIAEAVALQPPRPTATSTTPGSALPRMFVPVSTPTPLPVSDDAPVVDEPKKRPARRRGGDDAED